MKEGSYDICIKKIFVLGPVTALTTRLSANQVGPVGGVRQALAAVGWSCGWRTGRDCRVRSCWLGGGRVCDKAAAAQGGYADWTGGGARGQVPTPC